MNDSSFIILNIDMSSAFITITILSVALFCFCSAAFGFVQYLEPKTETQEAQYTNNRSSNQQDTFSNEPEPSFHEVVQRMGKTVLRPGGSAATKHILETANLSPEDTVLELSAGLGRTGIEIAQKYGCKVTITDIDTSRLEKAAARINTLGLSHLITVQNCDMFKIDKTLTERKYDVAQTEASLTHHPTSRKSKFFQDISNHANKFILHEMCYKTNDVSIQEQTRKDMSKVLKIGFCPETREGWCNLLVDAGFSNIEYVSTGDLAVLDPLSLIKDEGLMGFIKIVLNVSTHPYERKRMIATRREIGKHADDLGYITIVASKK